MWHARSVPSLALPLAETWAGLAPCFSRLTTEHPLVLRAFVLMGNHFHGILQASPHDLVLEPLLIHYLSPLLPMAPGECTCKKIATFRHYLETYKYVYRNPVESGFCMRVEHYPYSSLQNFCRPKCAQAADYFPIVDNLNLLQNPVHVIGWLNNLNSYFFQTNGFSSA